MFRRFLVQKDAKGKTQIHELSCRFLGKSGVHPCQCPHRLASGTVQSILGKLKSIFENFGKGSHWDELQAVGNPVCSAGVDRYLKAIRVEQAKSHVVQKQAKPLFCDKLRAISCHIDNLLEGADLKLSNKFLYLRIRLSSKHSIFRVIGQMT